MSKSIYGGSPAQRRQSLAKAAPRNIGPKGAGKGPWGTPIVPEGPNRNADRGSVVGGLQDATMPRSQMAGKIALHGATRNAAVATTTTDMNPPTTYPGQKGRAKPSAAAPSSLAMGKKTGHPGGSKSAGTGKARQALRGGGRTGAMAMSQQRMPSLPKPVTGMTQGGRGKNPGQSKLA